MLNIKPLFTARSGFCCVLTALLALGSQAQINYGDFSDIPPGTVMYTDVTETANAPAGAEPLYGAPSITANTLDFDPQGFAASSTDQVPRAAITDGQLNFGFMTDSGNGLTGLTISEGGDFTLMGGGTAATQVGAGLFIRAELTHINGTLIAQPLVVEGRAEVNRNLADNGGMNQSWSLSLVLDFADALTSANYDPNTDLVTKGEVAINNTLIAISESTTPTVAFIAKKDFKVTGTTAVPEPGSLALLGLGAWRYCVAGGEIIATSNRLSSACRSFGTLFLSFPFVALGCRHETPANRIGPARLVAVVLCRPGGVGEAGRPAAR